jgi:hypothetical protein
MALRKPLVLNGGLIQQLSGQDALNLCDFPSWSEDSNNWVQTRKAFYSWWGRAYAQSVQAATEFGSLSGSSKWYGGVLAPNGMIYGIPLDSTAVLKIDPTTDTATTFGSVPGGSAWIGGVLAPSGMIYGIPRDSTAVLKITPAADAATTFGSVAGGGAWSGGVLAPNGVIYGIPFNSTTVLRIGGVYDDVQPDFCLSRFFNKF